MFYYQIVLLSLILLDINICPNGHQNVASKPLKRHITNYDVRHEQNQLKSNTTHFSDEALRNIFYHTLCRDLDQLINKKKICIPDEVKDNQITLGDVKAKALVSPHENDPTVSKFYTFTKYAIDHPKPFTWTDILTAQLISLLSSTLKSNKEESVQLENNWKSNKDLFKYGRVYDKNYAGMPGLYEELNRDIFKQVGVDANVNRPDSANVESKNELTASCLNDLNSNYFARRNNMFKKILLDGLTKEIMNESFQKSHWSDEDINLFFKQASASPILKENEQEKDHNSGYNNKIRFHPPTDIQKKYQDKKSLISNRTNIEQLASINATVKNHPKVHLEFDESLNDCHRNSYPWESHMGYKLPTEKTELNPVHGLQNNTQTDALSTLNDGLNKFFVKLPMLNCINKTVNNTKKIPSQTFDKVGSINKHSNFSMLRNFAETLNLYPNKSMLAEDSLKSRVNDGYDDQKRSKIVNGPYEQYNLESMVKNITSDQATCIDLYKSLPSIIKYAFTVSGMKENSNPKLLNLLSSVAGDFMPLVDIKGNDIVAHKCKSSKITTKEECSKKNSSSVDLISEVKHRIMLPEYEKMANVTIPKEYEKKKNNYSESTNYKKLPSFLSSLKSDSGHWLAKLPLLEGLCQLMSSSNRNDSKIRERLFDSKFAEELSTLTARYSDDGCLKIPLSDTINKGLRKRKFADKFDQKPKHCFEDLSNNILQMMFLNKVGDHLKDGSKRVKKSLAFKSDTQQSDSYKDNTFIPLKPIKVHNDSLTNYSYNSIYNSAKNKSNFVLSLTESPSFIRVFNPNMNSNITASNHTKSLTASTSNLTLPFNVVTNNATLNVNDSTNAQTPKYILRKKIAEIPTYIDNRVSESDRYLPTEVKLGQQDKLSSIYITQNQSQKGSVTINLSPDQQQSGSGSVSINSIGPTNTALNQNFQQTKNFTSPGTSSITVNHPLNLTNPISINVGNVPLLDSNNQQILINISQVQLDPQQTKLNESSVVTVVPMNFNNNE